MQKKKKKNRLWNAIEQTSQHSNKGDSLLNSLVLVILRSVFAKA